jgi:hypothetical protein
MEGFWMRKIGSERPDRQAKAAKRINDRLEENGERGKDS